MSLTVILLVLSLFLSLIDKEIFVTKEKKWYTRLFLILSTILLILGIASVVKSDSSHDSEVNRNLLAHDSTHQKADTIIIKVATANNRIASIQKDFQSILDFAAKRNPGLPANEQLGLLLKDFKRLDTTVKKLGQREKIRNDKEESFEKLKRTPPKIYPHFYVEGMFLYAQVEFFNKVPIEFNCSLFDQNRNVYLLKEFDMYPDSNNASIPRVVENIQAGRYPQDKPFEILIQTSSANLLAKDIDYLGVGFIRAYSITIDPLQKKVIKQTLIANIIKY